VYGTFARFAGVQDQLRHQPRQLAVRHVVERRILLGEQRERVRGGGWQASSRKDAGHGEPAQSVQDNQHEGFSRSRPSHSRAVRRRCQGERDRWAPCDSLRTPYPHAPRRSMERDPGLIAVAPWRVGRADAPGSGHRRSSVWATIVGNVPPGIRRSLLVPLIGCASSFSPTPSCHRGFRGRPKGRVASARATYAPRNTRTPLARFPSESSFLSLKMRYSRPRWSGIPTGGTASDRSA
jgi:hypothetical protein